MADSREAQNGRNDMDIDVCSTGSVHPPVASSSTIESPPSFSQQGPAPTAASAVAERAAIHAAQQSVVAGQQAHEATQASIAAVQQSAAAGQQAQQATYVSATALQRTRELEEGANRTLTGIQTGMQTLHQDQVETRSIAHSSAARSSEAVRMMEELRRARLEDQRDFQS